MTGLHSTCEWRVVVRGDPACVSMRNGQRYSLLSETTRSISLMLRTCMKSDIIGDVTNYWTLQGCDLIAGTTYTLALYVEDGDMRKCSAHALY
eukprot:5155751-Amphidinium_carterae.1